MKATWDLSAAPRPTTACLTRRGGYSETGRPASAGGMMAAARAAPRVMAVRKFWTKMVLSMAQQSGWWSAMMERMAAAMAARHWDWRRAGLLRMTPHAMARLERPARSRMAQPVLRRAGSMARTRVEAAGGRGEVRSAAAGFAAAAAAEIGAEVGLGGRAVVEERGVEVVEVFETAAGDLLIDEAFDGFSVDEFVGAEDGEGVAFAFGAAGAADTVDVVFRVFGDGVIDDVADAGDVEATGGEIGGDDDVEFAVPEACEGEAAVFLGDVAVHDGDFVVFGFTLDAGGEFIGVGLGSGEDHDAFEFGFFEESEEEVLALETIDRVEVVADGGGGGARAADFDFEGVAEGPACEGGDFCGDGGGEEERLAVFGAAGDDAADVGHEAHVEHAVDLIEDEDFDVIELDGALLHVVEQTAGGSDEDIDPFLEPVALGAVADAAVDEETAEAGVAAVFLELFFDLGGEFADWFEDEAADSAWFCEAREDGEGEGGGFSGACLRGTDDVAAAEDDGDGLGLDACGAVVAGVGDAAEDII